MTQGFNPKDPRTNDWLKRQQDDAMKQAERARDLQRELDKGLPGKPPGNPPGAPLGS